MKYALWYLVQLLRYGETRRSATIRELNRAYRHFDTVTLDRSRSFLGDDIVAGRSAIPRLRSYYADAVDLARAVVDNQSINWDQEGERVRLPSLVLDMSSIFEKYLLRVLQLAAMEDHWSVAVLDGNKKQPAGGGKRLFDSGDDTEATPDVVIATQVNRSTRTYPLLIEVKYKPVPNREDLNQTIAYAATYRCTTAVIVQPRAIAGGAPFGMSLIGTIGDLTVQRYVYDLSADDLGTEERRFAEAIRGLATFPSS